MIRRPSPADLTFFLLPQSYIDVTPSPNKLLTDHPLSSFVKTEDEGEDTSCSVSVTVKQEAEPELPDIKTEEVLTDPVQSEQSEV